MTALLEYPVDAFLKVWAVLGTLVGLVTGAIPGFFFATSAQRKAGEADERQSIAQAKVETLVGLAEPRLIRNASELRPDLFATPPRPGGEEEQPGEVAE